MGFWKTLHFDVHEMAENEEAELEREIKFTTYFLQTVAWKARKGEHFWTETS